jgi:hypothetical protein
MLSARRNVRLALLVAALLIAAIFFGWRAYYYQEEGDPVASAMLAFGKAELALVVFQPFLKWSRRCRRSMGLICRDRQAAIIPANVEYRLDLSGMDASAMARCLG